VQSELHLLAEADMPTNPKKPASGISEGKPEPSAREREAVARARVRVEQRHKRVSLKTEHRKGRKPRSARSSTRLTCTTNHALPRAVG
jgi:hypothetical protein